MAGEHLDLASDPAYEAGEASDGCGRRFIGIHFACCGVYTRIYLNRSQTAYLGHCPKCLRRATIKVGPTGTSQRIFTAR